jgi:transcriptional regulator with XRE-family HTH domain
MNEWFVSNFGDSENERRLLQQEQTILEVTELICQLMEQQNVNRTELSRRLGKSKSYVSQLLDGSRNMTIRTVSDIMFYLNRNFTMQSRQTEHWSGRFKERYEFAYESPQRSGIDPLFKKIPEVGKSSRADVDEAKSLPLAG